MTTIGFAGELSQEIQRNLSECEQELLAFEIRYGMNFQEFSRQLEAGQLGGEFQWPLEVDAMRWQDLIEEKRHLLMSPFESQALSELKRTLFRSLDFVEKIVLFGSVARGEADDESDIDLLVLTTRLVSYKERHQITAIITDVNLDFETNFSSIVVDRSAWERGPISHLPIKTNIEREGVPV